MLPQPGNTLQADDRRRPPARGRAGAPRRDRRPRGIAGETYADGGAIVALDPHTGAVLALASNPTYEPSVYVSRDPAKLAPLQNAKVAAADNFPGLDRAIDGFYPPGSVWKPVTALAAMEEGILTPTESLLCSPVLRLLPAAVQELGSIRQPADGADPGARRVVRHLLLPGRRSSSTACRRAAGPTLQHWASRFGFGAPTGIDIGPENAGLVPTPDWRRKAFGGPPSPDVDRVWKPGYEVQLAIGQGDLEVTPIQMARFYAMIANGGQMVTPHIAQDVEQPTSDPTTTQVLRELATQQADAERRRPDLPARGAARACTRAPTRSTAPPTASSGSSRSRSPARPARPRRTSRSPAIRTR